MTGVEQQRIVKGTDKNGAERAEWHTLVHFEFVLVDSESGETKTCTWFISALAWLFDTGGANRGVAPN
jgi:hypothetical protein